MTEGPPEVFERLCKLSAQLYAVAMVSAEEDFSLWHPEIRNPYMWLVTDMSREMRDTLRRVVSTTPRRRFRQKRQKRRSG